MGNHLNNDTKTKIFYCWVSLRKNRMWPCSLNLLEVIDYISKYNYCHHIEYIYEKLKENKKLKFKKIKLKLKY